MKSAAWTRENRGGQEEEEEEGAAAAAAAAMFGLSFIPRAALINPVLTTGDAKRRRGVVRPPATHAPVQV